MELTCTVCKTGKHFKPSAAAQVNQSIYRCRKCFLAASGSRVVACKRCGKERKYDKTHFRKLDLDFCRDCYNKIRREQFVEITCRRCGKTDLVAPFETKRRRHGVNCKGCERVYDTSIPDTYSSGYLCGAMLGDGYFYTNDTGEGIGYGLRLEVTSPIFIQEFCKHVQECIGRQPWLGTKIAKRCKDTVPGMPDGEYLVFIAAIGSREWYEKLKPLKATRDFNMVRGKGLDFQRGFVQGMIDSEGYINPSYTDVANKDLELLGLVAEFLGNMGHKARVYGPYPYARGVAHLRVSQPLHKNQ